MKADTLTENWRAMTVFQSTVVHAILVFRSAIFIARYNALIS
jgi:hypothetical protein